MSSTLDYFVAKFGLDLSQPSPIAIPKAERPQMAQALCDLGYKAGAEVGVAGGEHAALLCQHNLDMTLFCIDPWMQVDGFVSWDDRKLDDWYNEARNRLAPYQAALIRKTSMEAVDDFEDGSLDFVYIDAAHDFRHIAEDLCEWIRKVRRDGIIFGHDFSTKAGGKYACHVEDVVIAYTKSHAISPWFVLGEAKQHISPHNHRPYNDVKEWMIIV